MVYPKDWMGRDDKPAPKLPPLKEEKTALEVINKRLNGHGRAIIKAADKAKVNLALGCAVVEKESHGKNIFGCDYENGRPHFLCHKAVNPQLIKVLLDHVARGGASNGVGLTQLTWPPFIRKAECLGRAHRPRIQCEVGFEILADLISHYGYEAGIGAYNAGPANWRSVYNSYVVPVAQLHREWLKLLNGLPTGLEPEEPEKPEPPEPPKLPI